MHDSQYLLLLNEQLKKDIVSLSPKDRDRLFEKLSFLENGMWDSGVRVKKLKGPSGKVVFEARISKGDRIIFTLGREGERTCIYLWETVHHDDISKEARKVYPDNAPFLDFEPVSDETLDELFIDGLSDDFFTQESMEQKVREDYGPQKWLDIGEEQLKRLLGTDHPDFFEIFLHLTGEQRQVLDLKPPVLLSGTAGSGKTTLAVYYLLKGTHSGHDALFITCSNFLRDFSENLYRGLVVHSPLERTAAHVRFSTLRELTGEILDGTGCQYDPKLEVGLKEFREIFSKHSLARKYDPELVWEEIRSIIKGAKAPASLSHFSNLIFRYTDNSLTLSQLHQLKESLLSLTSFDFAGKFDRIIWNKTDCADFTDFVQKLTLPSRQGNPSFAYVLGEILRILHAKEHHLTSPLLTLQEYLKLGKKRAPNFLYDREEIHAIAQYYQAQLDQEKRFDEIDLSRRAIIALQQSGDQFQQDLVVCDEVQDFSDIQLSFLFRLARVPGNIVCAGDPKQIINPSGFRWEELKNRFYERGIPVPDVRHLHLNFRCVGSIVCLSNALLKLKQQLVGISGYEQMEDWKFSGRPPFLIYGIPEQEMVTHIRNTAAGRIVLVRSNQEKRQLKKILETELIFTINEAKGLEFDTVVLWKFSSDAKASAIWRKIAGEHQLEPDHYPLIRHEINLLYVAVTRARNTLIIYDGVRISPVWQVAELTPHVFITREHEALDEIYKHVSTPGEWEKQGDYFFAREQYPVAYECYRNGANEAMADICRAHILKGDGHHLEAAGLFASRGRKAEAAQEFEDAEAYDKALVLWKELKRKDRVTRCTISLFESSGRYAEAAQLWVGQHRFDRAVENWKQAKAYTQLGDYWYKKQSYKQAAEYYGMDGQNVKAAICRKKLKEYRKAADLFAEGGDYASALPLYRRLKFLDGMVVCYTALEEHYQLGLIHEKRKEYDPAIASFSNYARTSDVHTRRLLDEAKAFADAPRSGIKAGLRYAAVCRYIEAADIFFKKGQYRLAADAYLRGGNPAAAATSFISLGEPGRAVDIYEELGDPASCRKTVDILRASLLQKRRGNRNLAYSLYSEAESCFGKQEYGKALTRFIAVNDPDGVLRSALHVSGRDEEAVDCLLEANQAEKASQLVARKKELSISEGYLEHLVGVNRVRNSWDILYDRKERFLLDLLAATHARNPGERTGIIRSYLYTFNMIYKAEDMPETLINLIVDTRCYSQMFRIIKQSFLHNRAFVDRFTKRLLALADSLDDNLMKAIALDAEPREIDALLGDMQPDIHTYALFGYVPNRFPAVLEFLLKRKDTEKAIALCIGSGRIKEAGHILEQKGNLKRAATVYRDGSRYEDALRCYEALRDTAGIARTYERMHEFDKALAVWTKLGKTREIDRLERKMGKLGWKQPELFPPPDADAP